MDNKRKDHPDPKRPPKGTTSNSYRPITCLVENTNGTNYREDLLLVYKPRTVSRGIDGMLQGNQMNRLQLCIDQYILYESKRRRKM